MLSWHGSHFWVCITFCRVRHGDSVSVSPNQIIIIIFIIIISYASGSQILLTVDQT